MASTDVESYFSSISPLARRVYEDIENTKQAYEDAWNTLDEKEKDQVINESLIDPATVLKYGGSKHVDGKIKTNSKFSWFTKSQLDLFNIKEDKVIRKGRSPCKKGPAPEPPVRVSSVPSESSSSVVSKQGSNLTVDTNLATTTAAHGKRLLIASPPCEPNNLFNRLKNRQRTEDRQPLVDRGRRTDDRQPLVERPKTPPPPPPTSDVSHTDNIPKTGFDFLDNW